MKDEMFVFYRDIREKSETAHSAKHRSGRGKKRWKMPTQKEINAMWASSNKEVIMSETKNFISYEAFRLLSPDMKSYWLKCVIDRYNVTAKALAKAWFVCDKTATDTLKKYDLARPRGTIMSARDKERWNAFVAGNDPEEDKPHEAGIDSDQHTSEIYELQKNTEAMFLKNGSMQFQGKFDAEKIVEKLNAIIGNGDNVEISINWFVC